MFRPNVTKAHLRDIIEDMSDIDFARFIYCQEMAGTFLAIGRFEDSLIGAMHMCDRVRLQKVLGDDTDRWARSVEKRSLLQGSTLGSLIKILERNDVSTQDIHYLRWIKRKRDYFVHRLFHDDGWPGDLSVDGCKLMSRRLFAIQLWLSRAERRIWTIFERANFLTLDRLKDGGVLAMNLGVYDLLDED